jgi:hypothetical protein
MLKNMRIVKARTGQSGKRCKRGSILWYVTQICGAAALRAHRSTAGNISGFAAMRRYDGLRNFIFSFQQKEDFLCRPLSN